MWCRASRRHGITLTSTSELRPRLLAQAAELGFQSARICRPESVDITDQLAQFTDAGLHGQMEWLKERQHWRARPDVLWPQARSVIVLAETYTSDTDPLAGLAAPETGNISVYARGRDYHDVVKKRLKRLARWLISQGGGEVKVFVDTAPVPEKPLAQAAGLGWQGKHTNLVSRDLGSWFFLGAVFTTLEFSPDAAEVDHCGSCRACLDICPTDAFPAPYRLDARRCISYLTIEHKGPVPMDLRPGLGNRIYGCDDCLAACPWNKFAQDAAEMKYAARPDLMGVDLAEFAGLDDAAFRARFSGSAIKRIGRDRFLRNVLYAIGNSSSPRLADTARLHLNDADETVAEAAQWALSRLEG